MEDCGLLDIDSEDLFAIHFVFIPRLNIQLVGIADQKKA